MLADILDAMQDCKDEIEVLHLHNCKSFHCKKCTNQYGKALQNAIEAQRFQQPKGCNDSNEVHFKLQKD
jgi:hypothetical protein